MAEKFSPGPGIEALSALAAQVGIPVDVYLGNAARLGALIGDYYGPGTTRHEKGVILIDDATPKGLTVPLVRFFGITSTTANARTSKSSPEPKSAVLPVDFDDNALARAQVVAGRLGLGADQVIGFGAAVHNPIFRAVTADHSVLFRPDGDKGLVVNLTHCARDIVRPPTYGIQSMSLH